ncbi:MAG: hypothetical protein ABF449_10760, partial [Ethanoligenens sp.]
MKQTSWYSKNFRGLAISVAICNIIMLGLLALLKSIISANHFSQWNPANRAIGFYVLGFAAMLFGAIMCNFDYKHLVNSKQATPRLWKKLYVIIIPV